MDSGKTANPSPGAVITICGGLGEHTVFRFDFAPWNAVFPLGLFSIGVGVCSLPHFGSFCLVLNIQHACCIIPALEYSFLVIKLLKYSFLVFQTGSRAN